MNKIANLILLDKVENLKFLNTDLIDIKYDYIKSNKPTLIVGFNALSKIIPELVINNNKIDEKTFWTFSPNEYKLGFRDDVDNFQDNLYDFFTFGYEYHFIDMVIDNIKVYGDILKLINNHKTIFYKHDMFLYFKNRDENIIYGLDLTYMAELGIDIEDFLSIVKLKTNFFFDESFEESGYMKTYEKMIERTIEPKYLILFLQNDN